MKNADGLFQALFVRNGQFLATFLATAGQYLATIRSLHSFAKTMHRFATAFVRLKSTFHSMNILTIIQFLSPGRKVISTSQRVTIPSCL
jgi:hypothetical protein